MPEQKGDFPKRPLTDKIREKAQELLGMKPEPAIPDDVPESVKKKRIKKTQPIETLEDVAGSDNFEEKLSDRDFLARSIPKLNQEMRYIVRLKFVDQLTNKEIASRLNKSESWVAVQLNSSISKLRKMAK